MYLIGSIVLLLFLLGGEIAWYARQITRKLDWQHDTIVPWINNLNEKLNLPK